MSFLSEKNLLLEKRKIINFYKYIHHKQKARITSYVLSSPLNSTAVQMNDQFNSFLASHETLTVCKGV